MENKSDVVYFRIGSNFGVTLAELGQEELLYNMDFQRAVNVYKDSLIGITNEQIYPLLICKNILTIDVENQVCNVVERTEEHSNYPTTVDLINFISTKVTDFIKTVYDVRPVFKRLIYSNDTLNIDVSIPFNEVIKHIYYDGLKNDKLFNKYIDFEENFGEIESVIKIYKDIITDGLRFIELCKVLDKIYSLEIYSYFTKDIEKSSTLRADLDCLFNYIASMQSDIIGYTNDDFHKELEYDELKSYIASIKNNNNVLSTEIQPVNIFDKYDAGWLSPDGLFYGLNGHIANMLHITIAEALQKKGVIPDDVTNQSLWLDENGWVKIHHDNINFGSYAHSQIHFKKPKFMTDKQIDIVYRYGQTLYSGLLKIGYLLQPMTAVKFEMFANAESEKLYELF